MWIYLDWNRAAFPDEVACMNAVMANLEGDTTEWMVALHDKGTLELGNVDAFLEELWARFRDPTQTHQVEYDICFIRQRNQSLG